MGDLRHRPPRPGGAAHAARGAGRHSRRGACRAGARLTRAVQEPAAAAPGGRAPRGAGRRRRAPDRRRRDRRDPGTSRATRHAAVADRPSRAGPRQRDRHRVRLEGRAPARAAARRDPCTCAPDGVGPVPAGPLRGGGARVRRRPAARARPDRGAHGAPPAGAGAAGRRAVPAHARGVGTPAVRAHGGARRVREARERPRGHSRAAGRAAPAVRPRGEGGGRRAPPRAARRQARRRVRASAAGGALGQRVHDDRGRRPPGTGPREPGRREPDDGDPQRVDRRPRARPRRPGPGDPARQGRPRRLDVRHHDGDRDRPQGHQAPAVDRALRRVGLGQELFHGPAPGPGREAGARGRRGLPLRHRPDRLQRLELRRHQPLGQPRRRSSAPSPVLRRTRRTRPRTSGTAASACRSGWPARRAGCRSSRPRRRRRRARWPS